LPAPIVRDRVVRLLQGAEQSLARANNVAGVKLVMDVAAAQKVLATRQRLGDDVIGYAHEIRFRALARLGELLRDMPKRTTAHSRGGGSKGSRREPLLLAPATLDDLGVNKKTSMIAQQLARLPRKTRDAIARREETLSAALRKTKAAEIRRVVSLPNARYRVLYADPPWAYNDKSDAGSVQTGGAEVHYPTMTIAELCALDVVSLCEPNAVLFLWVTSPLLFESAAVIKAWGFAYRALFVWDKVKHNRGHYNSVRHEFLLICTRGSCTPDVVKLFDSVQAIERTAHSEKPEEFREIINTLYPHGKRIELFARRTVAGWDGYGYETPHAVLHA
jgi:N6-adenosine-specific RNA methylase IME4